MPAPRTAMLFPTLIQLAPLGLDAAGEAEAEVLALVALDVALIAGT